MAWKYLLISSFFEIIFAIGLKYTFGFSRFFPSLITVVASVFGLVTLSQALKTLPVGTAYAVWTGIGTVGTTVLGMFLFNESRDLTRIGFIVLIIISVVGLRLTASR